MTRRELFIELFRHFKAILIALGLYFEMQINDIEDLQMIAKKEK